MIWLAGEDGRKRGERFMAILQAWQQEGREVNHLNLAKGSVEELSAAMAQTDLFGQARAWVVRGLESNRSPKQRQAMLEFLLTQSEPVVIDWGKNLTPAQKKLAAKWKLETFLLPNVLFKWVEGIGVMPREQLWRYWQQAQAQVGKDLEALNAVLMSHLRSLMAVRVGATEQLPPWRATKLKQQAQRFTPQEIARWLMVLHDFELALKSGNKAANWAGEIDILLLSVYDVQARPGKESYGKR